MSILKIENLNKNFDKMNILKNMSLEFDSNYSYGIIGASGSGKSTFLSLISGLDTPTSGNIYFNGVSLISLNKQEKAMLLNKNIGLVFQQPYLLSELSVLENVIIKELINSNYKSNLIELGLNLLEFVGLESKASLYPNILSGGEQQRVAIARALFNKPQFLIADEPTAHLDSETSANIINLLKSSHKEWGLGLIIASHDPSIIKELDIIYEIKKTKA